MKNADLIGPEIKGKIVKNNVKIKYQVGDLVEVWVNKNDSRFWDIWGRGNGPKNDKQTRQFYIVSQISPSKFLLKVDDPKVYGWKMEKYEMADHDLPAKTKPFRAWYIKKSEIKRKVAKEVCLTCYSLYTRI